MTRGSAGELAALGAAEQILGTYFRAVDDGYDLPAMRALFAEGAECRTDLAPEVRTVDEFMALQSQASRIIEWAFHLRSGCGFEAVSEGRSRGQWNVLGLHTVAENGGHLPVFYTARYAVTFVEVDGAWRIESLATTFHQVSRLHEGWVAEPFYAFKGLGGAIDDGAR